MGAFDIRKPIDLSSIASQVGDCQEMLDMGPLIKKPSGEVWMRTGTVALSTLYPTLAAYPQFMCSGVALGLLPSSAGISGFATNGAGVAVVATGVYGTTNLWYTANYGATWSLVAHNNGAGNVSDVCWTGTRFVTIGCNGTNLYTSYSTTGAAFTAGTSIASTAAQYSARIVWDGSIALAIGGGSTAAASTTDGTALTSKTLSTTFTNPKIAVMTSLGVARWFIVGSSTACIQSTAADGSAWAARTAPSSSQVICAGLGYFVIGNGQNVYYSTTGADGSWSTSIIPAYGNCYPSLGGANLTFDGARFLIGGYASSGTGTLFAYTTDLINFNTRQLAFPLGNGTNYMVCLPFANGALAFLPSGNSGSYCGYTSNWMNSSEYVGIVPISSTQPTNGNSMITGSRPKIYYLRVK